MAARKGRYTRLLVGSTTAAWDFSGVSNSLEVSLDAERLDTTAFQETGATSISGDTSGSITQNGYFQNAAAGEFEQEMAAAVASTTSLYVAALFGTDTDGCPAYVAPAANAGGLTIGSEVAGLITVQGEWAQGTGLLRGLRVWTGTITATGAQTSPAYLDLGAAGAAGGTAWLWVTGVTGTATNAAIVLQSSTATNFASPTTRATFTFSSASGRAQQQSMGSGTVDRYLRLNTTGLGGATNFTVTVVAAVRGVTT